MDRVTLLLALMVPGLLSTPGNAHEWYTGQTNEAGNSCCGGNDCAGSDYVWRRVEGGYEVDVPVGSHPMVNTNYFPAGTTQTFRFEGNPGGSPDGQVHICITAGQARAHKVQCLFLGGSV